MSDTQTILEEAQGLIYGDRQASYGSATENFNKIAIGWSAITGNTISAEQVGLMMMWLKMARQLNKSSRDNLVDIAGYAGCLEKIEKGE